MASGFSGVLKLTDLDDFITPSQQCVKPVQPPTRLPGSTNSTKLEKAKISLNDCLACSGCVTSAESVLIGSQSFEEFLKCIESADQSSPADSKIFILTLSPQSVASMAAVSNLSIQEATLKVSGMFRSFGVSFVFDSSFARSFSLIETANEFISRFKLGETHLPLLASSCPGWICYAEKTHGNTILPFISTAKSPQQVAGSLIKSYIASMLGTSADNIYHLSLMPCYDKKLEASRQQFYSDIYRTRDVDMVLTSVEIGALLEARALKLTDYPSVGLNSFSDLKLEPVAGLIGHKGGGAGGYLEHTLVRAAKQLFNIEVNEISYTTLKNKDIGEVTVEKDGQTVLTFAYAYGFRNIQNVVQKIKRKKCPYHFVEVMACPSGCLNGGGQMRASEMEHKDHLNDVIKLYDTIPLTDPFLDLSVKRLYSEWLEGENSDKVVQYLHTSYKAIDKTISLLSIKCNNMDGKSKKLKLVSSGVKRQNLKHKERKMKRDLNKMKLISLEGKISNNQLVDIINSSDNLVNPLELYEKIKHVSNTRERSKLLFEWLIRPIGIEQFFREYWEKKAMVIKRNIPNYFSNLFSSKEFDTILNKESIEYSVNLDVTQYQDGKRHTLNPEGRAYPSVVWKFYEEGCSLRFLNPQTYSDSLWWLNATLQDYFHSFVGANMLVISL
ncbi:Cytosolic Fe-S cluster assembly factor narfl-like [Oopsacas minuta]|uniref:Cytosolic Fe-S cluster assembly factor narfl-like n=1 Tax=Oopsacas minuta TaxID=111878 RepID=A0AAV7KBJ3_9METZ|nr:Cytosolic Fe-S cluster assembly factor narfl-like [Oopsacas minuta]